MKWYQLWYCSTHENYVANNSFLPPGISRRTLMDFKTEQTKQTDFARNYYINPNRNVDLPYISSWDIKDIFNVNSIRDSFRRVILKGANTFMWLWLAELAFDKEWKIPSVSTFINQGKVNETVKAMKQHLGRNLLMFANMSVCAGNSDE